MTDFWPSPVDPGFDVVSIILPTVFTSTATLGTREVTFHVPTLYVDAVFTITTSSDTISLALPTATQTTSVPGAAKTSLSSSAEPSTSGQATSQSGSLSPGAKAGIGVAAALIVVLAIIGFLLWRRRHLRLQKAQATAHSTGTITRDDTEKVAVTTFAPAGGQFNGTEKGLNVMDKAELEATQKMATTSVTLVHAELPGFEVTKQLERPADATQAENKSQVHVTVQAVVPEKALQSDTVRVYSDLPEVATNQTAHTPVRDVPNRRLVSKSTDPILAQIEDDERLLEERQRRLQKMEKLDAERRELQQRRAERMRESM